MVVGSAVANKQLLASLLFLLVGLSVAQGRRTSSDSPGYTAVVTFRVNATSSAIKSARCTISVWNPTVTRAEDYSLGKISVVRVDHKTKDITASIESGYIVFPKKYGDSKPRFFVRWKNVDINGTRTGCFDLECEGFVPTPAAGGLDISMPLSGRSLFPPLNLMIEQNLSTGNWELTRHSLMMGYWPASLFSTGKVRCIIVNNDGRTCFSVRPQITNEGAFYYGGPGCAQH